MAQSTLAVVPPYSSLEKGLCDHRSASLLQGGEVYQCKAWLGKLPLLLLFFFLLPLVIRTKFDEEPGFQLKWGESRNCFLFVFILIYDDGKILSCLEDGQHPQASVVLLVLKYSKSSYWPCQNCSRIFVYVQCKWLLFQNGVFCGKHQLATQLFFCKEKKKSLFFYSSVC